ncbi:DELLA protein GAI [Acorus calamus]|uniref:DELLA protein GAI n=1 Tax=Acorus calamus TaxID=4465 RepID=A0AAV9D4A7_ACOCL|nr:DELLA protein GAI [Acorus calamus]
MPYKRHKTDVVGDTGPVGLPHLGFRDHVESYKQRFFNGEGLDAIAGNEVEVGGGGGRDAMDLVRMLISCVEAVAYRDWAQASALLIDLRAHAQALGTSFQRVASCFVVGLSDRLSVVGPLGSLGSVGLTKCGMPGPSPEWDEALGLAYKMCLFIRFGHFVANESMLEVLAGESSAHVVDLGMSLGLPMGHQWRDLIQSLVDWPCPPMHRIRLTGVGPRTERLESIGDGLVDFAHGLGLELEFQAIVTNLEGLRPEDVRVEKGEVLVVNSVLELHHVVKESRGALKSMLQTVHRLAPRVLVLVEQDVNNNGPFFMGRFMEAMHYYSVVFDALDMALPRYDTRWAKME